MPLIITYKQALHADCGEQQQQQQQQQQQAKKQRSGKGTTFAASICLFVLLSLCLIHWKNRTSSTVWKFYFQNISIPRKICPYHGTGQNYGNWIFQPFSSMLWKRSDFSSDSQWSVHVHLILGPGKTFTLEYLICKVAC